MDAVLPFAGVAALRLNSDVIVWEKNAVGVRKDKQPMAPGGRWVGLILLFSTQTGEPLAIMPDGVIQQLRVGGTNGVAAKLMAPPDARVYALLGAGEQAATQAAAMAAVRPLKQIRVVQPDARAPRALRRRDERPPARPHRRRRFARASRARRRRRGRGDEQHPPRDGGRAGWSRTRT